LRIIAGSCRGRTLKTVSGPGYRPAMSKVRESLFSMLESRGVVWSGGIRVLDLFAGSGSLGFEALSRGAELAVFVETGQTAAACLSANARLLGLEDRCRILTEDARRVSARRPPDPFDVIFVDPPYGQDLLGPVMRNLLRLDWLATGGFLAAEVEKGLPLPPAPGLEMDTERRYGQTRIVLWTRLPD